MHTVGCTKLQANTYAFNISDLLTSRFWVSIRDSGPNVSITLRNNCMKKRMEKRGQARVFWLFIIFLLLTLQSFSPLQLENDFGTARIQVIGVLLIRSNFGVSDSSSVTGRGSNTLHNSWSNPDTISIHQNLHQRPLALFSFLYFSLSIIPMPRAS